MTLIVAGPRTDFRHFRAQSPTGLSGFTSPVSSDKRALTITWVIGGAYQR